MKPSDQIKQDILNDPCASYWLKYALETLDNRDVVDAANDVDVLRDFIEAKIKEVNR